MPINSNAKGKAGERLLCKYLKSLGYHDAQRTQQYNGLGLSDVICPETLPNLHIECKFGYPISTFDLETSKFTDAVEQCIEDSDGNPWALFWKPKHYRNWRLSFLSKHLTQLVTTTGNRNIDNTLQHLSSGEW